MTEKKDIIVNGIAIMGLLDLFACLLFLVTGKADVALVLAVLYVGFTIEECYLRGR